LTLRVTLLVLVGSPLLHPAGASDSAPADSAFQGPLDPSTEVCLRGGRCSHRPRGWLLRARAATEEGAEALPYGAIGGGWGFVVRFAGPTGGREARPDADGPRARKARRPRRRRTGCTLRTRAPMP